MDNKRVCANPGPWLTFIFACIMWVFAADYLGILTGDRYLLLGTMMLVTLPFWVKGADLYYQTENDFMGHFYMVFGVMFGGILAVAYIVFYFSHLFGLGFDERFMGIIYLVAGVFLLPMLPSFFYLDKVNFVTWSTCIVWFFAGGAFYFLYSSMVLYWVNVMCCVIVALGVTYMMLSEAYQMCYEKPLPMGKPIK